MAHPRMYDESSAILQRLREICLALPECFEKEAWGECTFRVMGGSMFAMTDNHHHGSEHVAVWVKAPVTVQEILVHADRERFFVPPYVGSKGWVGVRLDRPVDWEELAGIIADAHRMSAPRRLLARLAADSEKQPGSGATKKRLRASAKAPGKRGAKRPK